MLHPAGKYTYEIELFKNCRINDIFHVLLLDQDNNTMEIELNSGNSKDYEIKAVCDSKVYTQKSNNGHLQGLYYVYLKNKNI